MLRKLFMLSLFSIVIAQWGHNPYAVGGFGIPPPPPPNNNVGVGYPTAYGLFLGRGGYFELSETQEVILAPTPPLNNNVGVGYPTAYGLFLGRGAQSIILAQQLCALSEWRSPHRSMSPG
ncbi:unnamed protein product [Strongylus vulgaris]|uniref:Uncharacterized protein n=1 Tax=Strongylus vulgaris TaxID=40348 RepID=A0A3P7JSN8_STRVU|nr:unnamed protein product [Strongylus vulgaris]